MLRKFGATVHDTITIRVPVKVVVEAKDIQLNVSWPGSHDLELPQVILRLCQGRRDTVTMLVAIACIRVRNMIRGGRSVRPVRERNR